MSVLVKRSFSGISNPFTVAEAVLGKRINWIKKTHQEKTRILENVFEMPYCDLFDPKNGSPLFRINTRKSDAVSKHSYGAATCIKPGAVKDFSAWNYSVNNRDVRDPIQGSVPDCWLISAIASLAWTKPAGSDVLLDQKAPYHFNFNGGNDYGKTSAMLPVDEKGNLIYCRSNDTGELWVSVYEKAYFQWREFNATGASSDTPDYCKFGLANHPLQGISHLTKLALSSTEIPGIKYDANKAFLDIYNTTKAFKMAAIDRRTTKPAIAWTYDTTVMPSGYSSQFGSADPGYDTSTLPSSHCFSILGTYGKISDVPDKKYIVLRNPYGPPSGDPNVPGLLTGNTSCCGFIVAEKDGVFAISAAEFVKKFQGYGWGY